jgi:hypothetical protein
MNFVVFYLILVVQIMLCNAMQPHTVVELPLPEELHKKISSLFTIDPGNVVSLCKYNEFSNQNVHEKLHFPSNSPVNFVRALLQASDAVTLCTLKNGCKAVPNIQLWLGLDRREIRIDDDLARINTIYPYYDASKESIILFDELKHNVVVVEMNAPFGTISVRDLQNNARVNVQYLLNNHIKWKGSRYVYSYPLSLCFHSGLSDWLCSVVVKQMIDGPGQPEKNVQEIIFFSNTLVPKNIAFNAQTEIPLIKKHEWFGKNSFLFSTVGQLFFGLYNGNNTLSLHEQKFYISKAIENQLTRYKQLSVVSFSVNQDSDKKTALERSRFFAVLVEDTTEDYQDEQIVFLCDLLSPYNSIKRIWSSFYDPNFRQKICDRISFHDNTISLWKDETSSQNALKIELPSAWTDMSERDLLFQQACKKGILLSLLNALK